MKTILLVDDDRARSEAFASVLANEGYAVDAASSCHQALTKLFAMPTAVPCVVLLRAMSELTGKELLAELHAKGRTTRYPVVVLLPEEEAVPLERLLAMVHDVCDEASAPS